MAGLLQRFFGRRRISQDKYVAERAAVLKEAPIPTFWLFGKTGSGKTSVIRFLTGAEQAEIGNGFKSQTAMSRTYDFPCAETPLLQFIDTRGLGEATYDAAEDIQWFAGRADLMIVTAKVMDHSLEMIVRPLSEIRRAAPGRPVLLVLTCLHEGYPGQPHPQPDPFGHRPLPDSLPLDLRRSVERHEEEFKDLVDQIVLVDLTQQAEGYHPSELGGERLKSAIFELLPAAYRQTLRSLDDALRSLRGINERRAMPYILGASTLAATAGAVPLPWVDVPLVIAIQGSMVAKLASLFGQPVGAELLASLPGPMGSRLATRLLLRSTWKFIPYVGIAANAALSYATTYGLGKACCWYFGQLREGNIPTERELQAVWSEQMTLAARHWSLRRQSESK